MTKEVLALLWSGMGNKMLWETGYAKLACTWRVAHNLICPRYMCRPCQNLTPGELITFSSITHKYWRKKIFSVSKGAVDRIPQSEVSRTVGKIVGVWGSSSTRLGDSVFLRWLGTILKPDYEKVEELWRRRGQCGPSLAIARTSTQGMLSAGVLSLKSWLAKLTNCSEQGCGYVLYISPQSETPAEGSTHVCVKQGGQKSQPASLLLPTATLGNLFCMLAVLTHTYFLKMLLPAIINVPWVSCKSFPKLFGMLGKSLSWTGAKSEDQVCLLGLDCVNSGLSIYLELFIIQIITLQFMSNSRKKL